MSLARKCDKCGVYYTPNDYKLNLTKKEIVGFEFIDKYVDLCPDCQKILEEWMVTPDKSYILLNSNAKQLLEEKIHYKSSREGGCGWPCILLSDLFDILREFDLIDESEVENDKT